MTVIIQFVIYSQQTYSFEVKYTTKWPLKQVSQIIGNSKRPEFYILMIICSQINPSHCFSFIFKLKHNVENNMYPQSSKPKRLIDLGNVGNKEIHAW